MSDQTIYLKAPASFIPEKQYIAKVIFDELLGVEYHIVFSDELKDRYIMSFGEATIEIEDHFFNKCNEVSGYLKQKFIPESVSFSSNQFTLEKDVPSLFGDGCVDVEEDKITSSNDIFASVFFMLSRWEESVITVRDYLHRFPVVCSLAFKFGFLHRPVVNEWVGMLKNMIVHLAPGFLFRPKQNFEIVFTHDIDLLNAPVSIKEFAKDVIRRRSVSALVRRSRYLLKRSNPYDTFDYFMDASEQHNTRSRFYFMTGHNVPGRDGEPYNKTPFYKIILQHIQAREHIIGFHPSLLSYNNAEMFAQEKRQLESDIQSAVYEGRQHALRCELPETWNMWERNALQLDSTLGYSAKEGFRCGTGNTFSVFNVWQRTHLSLKEMPLIVMDTTLNVNRKLNVDESAAIIKQYIGVGRRYNMPITLLFHNLIKDEIDWKGWEELYDNLFYNNKPA